MEAEIIQLDGNTDASEEGNSESDYVPDEDEWCSVISEEKDPEQAMRLLYSVNPELYFLSGEHIYKMLKLRNTLFASQSEDDRHSV